MRAKHTLHQFSGFPAYASGFTGPNTLVLGGGGGNSKTGIKNQIRLYNINDASHAIELLDTVQLAPGEDAPMSLATAVSEPHPTIVCGVNSPEEDMLRGQNENCRVFSVLENKLALLSTRSTLPGGPDSADDYQKVTTLSTDSSMVAVAGNNTLSVLSYPALLPLAAPIVTDQEIWDASFSPDSLLITTDSKLLVYALPESSSQLQTSEPLSLVETIPPPASDSGSVFRAAKYHPSDPEVLYSITNTVPNRNSREKRPQRRGFAQKWSRSGGKWKVDKVRKISDKGVTTVDISPNGKYLAFGASDLKIGLLDLSTLSPVLTILDAHQLPPTTLTFNSTGTLLVSGSADHSIRIIAVPERVGGYSWGLLLLILLTLLVLLLALVAQRAL
ncbi:WD40 repeat-like protein [Flagelloscypha sp. PMI_526]|nr:WD40 repeat-like protein [Flagelloscypha sp. PMI_526]